MIVSRSSAEEDVVAGLRSGADALVVDGVGAREFVARIRALLRRTPPTAREEPDAITVGPVVLNRATRQVLVDGTPIAVPRREFDILDVLMRAVDRTVTRDSLRRQLWGTARDSRTLDVQVRRLRARLAAAEGQRRIVTVRGVGYRFSSAPEPVDSTLDSVEITLAPPAPELASAHPSAADACSAPNR
jgi:two-component system response regulator RegX3